MTYQNGIAVVADAVGMVPARAGDVGSAQFWMARTQCLNDSQVRFWVRNPFREQTSRPFLCSSSLPNSLWIASRAW